MTKKYQIFVSSTFEDLKGERDQVIRAILEMGHLPVGMEMFSAADDEQWGIIKNQIDQSDYYVIIAAHRYGSMDGDISYTEKEYDYATSQKIPTLGFIIEDSAEWPQHYIDKDTKKIKKLNRFKEKIKKKLVSFWKTGDDLHTKVITSLVKQFSSNPRIGWIRANEAADPKTAHEITRLSTENALLRKEQESLRAEIEKLSNKDEKEIVSILSSNKTELSYFEKDAADWSHRKSFSLFYIFYLLGPELMIEKSNLDSASFLGRMTCPEGVTLRTTNYPLPSNTMKGILADFLSLNLVEPSKKEHPVNDKEEYWTLTDKGKSTLSHIRRENLKKPKNTLLEQIKTIANATQS